MLQNASLDAKIGFDPAENEPPKECCVVAGISLLHAGAGAERLQRDLHYCRSSTPAQVRRAAAVVELAAVERSLLVRI